MDATRHPRRVTHGMNHVVHLCEWLTLSQVASGRINGKENQENNEIFDKSLRI